MEKQIEALLNIPDYDIGLINDYGRGNVQWWQDYIRNVINSCNQYWRDMIESELKSNA